MFRQNDWAWLFFYHITIFHFKYHIYWYLPHELFMWSKCARHSSCSTHFRHSGVLAHGHGQKMFNWWKCFNVVTMVGFREFFTHSLPVLVWPAMLNNIRAHNTHAPLVMITNQRAHSKRVEHRPGFSVSTSVSLGREIGPKLAGKDVNSNNKTNMSKSMHRR